ncbi:MAG: hypothetical protein WD114_00330 [Phycisphaerales bacterium]
MAHDETNPESQELDLDASIDALLSEIEEACAPDKPKSAAKSATGTAPKPEPESETEPEVEPEPDANESIPDSAAEEPPPEPAPQEPDEPLENAEVTAEVESEPASEGDDALEAIDSVADSAQSLIEDAIDNLLDGDGIEEQDNAEDTPDEAGDDPLSDIADALDDDHGADTLEDLDDAIAGLDDDLLMGDFETPEGELVDAQGVSRNTDSATLMEQLGLPDEPTDQADEEDEPDESDDSNDPDDSDEEHNSADPMPAGDEAPAQPAAPSPAAVAPTAARPEAFARIEEADDDADVVSIWETALRIGRERATQAVTIARVQGLPLAARAVLAISKPVKNKPAQLRDSIGYVALWTLLLASVLWFYTLFLRATPVPTPTQAPTRVLAPDDAADPLGSSAAAVQP